MHKQCQVNTYKHVYISEWFTIKTAVLDTFTDTFTHIHGSNSGVCNVLVFSDLNIYTKHGHLDKPNQLKPTIIKQK